MGSPRAWYFQRVSFGPHEAYALNKTANWNFNGNSTGWTATNGTGSGATANGSTTCGTTSDVSSNSMATFGYNGALSGQTAFQAVSGSTKNTDYRGIISQTFVAPGSGTVKAKGKFSYYGSSSNWGTAKVSLDLWDSTNTTFIAELNCQLISSNTAWSTASFGSDVSITGGTTYTIRINLITRTKSNSNTAVTSGVDNIVVNVAPTGLSASSVSDSKNASLSWTASSAGSGANGLHGTTPYKVYRDTSSPVSTFLANATTNSYTDSSTDGNTTYYYAVSNIDTASDESPLSDESSVLTRPGVPGTPTFTGVTQTSITVNWTDPTGGASSYKVERADDSGGSPGSFVEQATGVTSPWTDPATLTCNTTYWYRVRGTNASGDGGYSSNASQTTASCGSLSVDIVDGAGSSVASPSTAMTSKSFSWTFQTSTGTFGISTEQVRVSNPTGNAQWTLSIAAENTTDLWNDGAYYYDFNDPTANAVDGADTDSYGGQMTINPAASTITPQGGCSTTGLTKGSSAGFSEGSTDSITLLTAGATADTSCYWDITDIGISQTIPAEQNASSGYNINFIVSVIAN